MNGNLFNQEEVKLLPNGSDATAPTTELNTSTIAATDAVPSGAAMYFERDGENLILRTKDLKGSTWAEQQKRFVLMYTAAYPALVGRPVPSKDHFKTPAEKASVYDMNNFSRYVTETAQAYFTEKSDGITLNMDGDDRLLVVLSELCKSDNKPGFAYWDRSHKSEVKRSRLTADEKAVVAEWSQAEVNLSQLNIVQIKESSHYVMLSLWIVTVHLAKKEAVSWNEAHLYLTTKYKNVSITAEAFSKAIRNERFEKFIRSGEHGFYLTQEGRDAVEGWVSGKPLVLNEGK